MRESYQPQAQGTFALLRRTSRRCGGVVLAALLLAFGQTARAEECRAPAPEASTKEVAVPQSADVLVLGDSIAAAWPRTLLESTYPGRRVAKIAVSGERVQQTRWKIETGRFDHLRPRTVIVLVGTNNLGRNTPCAISQGILDIVDDVERRWKPEQLVVFGILPRGSAGEYQRSARAEINAAVRNGLASRTGVRFIELDDKMSCAPCAAYRPDNTHLTTDGYRILTGALK